MSLYVGIAGDKAKEVASLYIGVNGVAKEVTELYCEDKNSIETAYSGAKPKGETIFTTSGVFEVPSGVKSVDVFLVGGGGGSVATAGAGGGYTKTTSLNTSSANTINVVVGAGGGGSSGNKSWMAAEYIYADGGQRATNVGGDGGSGGGHDTYSGAGGSDGEDGESYYSRGTGRWYDGGVGQGTTTRAFKEPNGTLYAGGGGGSTGGTGGAGGGGNYKVAGAANTGGGAGGGNGSGGSGIVIVRWGY